MAKKLKIDHRTGGGRRKQEPKKFDLGTPELIAKRLRALGPQRDKWPQPDPCAAESALGVLLWQGELDANYERAKRLHDAGVTFAGWWTVVHPKSNAQGTLGQFQPKGSTEDVDTGYAEACLKAVSERLKIMGPRYWHSVVNVAVYNSLENRGRDKVRAALAAIIQWFNTPQAETIRKQYENVQAA